LARPNKSGALLVHPLRGVPLYIHTRDVYAHKRRVSSLLIITRILNVVYSIKKGTRNKVDTFWCGEPGSCIQQHPFLTCCSLRRG